MAVATSAIDPVRPGGIMPKRYDPIDITFISFIVTQLDTCSFKRPAASSTHLENITGASGMSQKSSPSQDGWVK